MGGPNDPMDDGKGTSTAWIPWTVLVVGILLILGFVFRIPW